MRKIVSGFAASVDGYIEEPNGAIDWILIDEAIDFEAQMKRYDTFLYGRRSYEQVLKMGVKPAPGTAHYVFSTTLLAVAEGYTLINKEATETVKSLKAAEGKDIGVFGGAGLLTWLLEQRLVDEVVITVIPVLLGSGKPMVDLLPNRVWLRLLKTHNYANGSVQISYEAVYDPI